MIFRWLNWLMFGAAESQSQPEGFICSACYAVHPFDEAMVLPWWHPSPDDFVTSYRCKACFPKSIAETRAKVQNLTEDVRTKMCACLRLNGLVTEAKHLAEMSLPDAEKEIVKLLQGIENRSVVLPMPRVG